MGCEDKAPWPIEPHTIVKHRILREYLSAWFPILGQSYPEILYLDGFCGPGEYLGGEPGSPIVALETALKFRKVLGHVSFIFVDECAPYIAHLSKRLERIETPSNYAVETQPYQFATVLRSYLDERAGKAREVPPTFAFIDPFGWSGFPIELVWRLIQNPRTEVFINFNVNRLNQFLEAEAARQSIVDLFGTSKALGLAKEKNRYEALRGLYKSRLEEQAQYVSYFSMHGLDNRPVYDLFFAGNNSLGYQHMKSAMWKADPAFGARFSDAADPSQSIMFEADPVSRVLEEILSRFDGVREVHEVYDWVKEKTKFLQTHARKALLLGEAERKFVVHRTRSDGKARRADSFPAKAVVDFSRRPEVQGNLFGG